jgi:uncharacterized protein YndB with AHSA1/START domain
MSNANQQTNALTVTPRADREIVSERTFDAPRERVFAAFTDPELIPQWWGPHGGTTIVAEMDVRPGGAWRYIYRNEDGSETAFRGVYREVTPPERLAQSFEYEPMPGYISIDISTFEDLGDGRTKVTTVSQFHTPEERDGMLAAGMAKGMGETYDRLEELLARGNSA